MQKTNHLKKAIGFASKIMDEPHEYENSYVAFLDILGFKEMVCKKSSQEIKTIYDEIRMVTTLFSDSDLYDEIIPRNIRENTKTTFLSDSIIINIPSNITSAFYGLVVICLYIQNKLIGLKKPILIRGAICRGNCFRYYDMETNALIIYGPCVNEAYKLQENLAIYPRIIIEDLLFDSEKKAFFGNDSAFLNTFIRKSDDGYWFLDYMKMRMILSEPRYETIKEFILSGLAQNDERILQKFRWMKDYYNNSLEVNKPIINTLRNESIIE